MSENGMSDERREYLWRFIENGLNRLPSNEGSANHWLWTADELRREIDRLRARVEELEAPCHCCSIEGNCRDGCRCSPMEHLP